LLDFEARHGRLGEWSGCVIIQLHQCVRLYFRLSEHGFRGIPAMVSIPLISGHQSGRPRPAWPVGRGLVSIPLISGHQSGHGETDKPLATARLNPFDIRASVRTAGALRGHCRFGVSIPLISGHQSGHAVLEKAAKDILGLNPFDIRASVRTRFKNPARAAASQSL